MRTLMKAGAIAAVAAASLMGFGAPAFAESTVVVWNSTSIGPQITTTLSQKCPSTEPYPVKTTVSSGTKDSYNSQYLNYKNLTVDGRVVKMTFTNSQSLRDQHPVTLSVKLEILCSNVPQQPVTSVELKQSASITPGGDALVTVSCPPTHSHVTGHEERHPAGVAVVDYGQEGSSYWVRYENDDFLNTAWADLYLTCSA
ncbi:hypothetical protein [Microbispora sp. ATCC PTA-5024]|uniref:hypothetical protein n=1 Tax=Microbispora sp. ATCC PTA-5024 TaxID=316330 RepID=UPI0003DBF23B|nr:hypothetical protein [Microbispora sp. ATCC PTA-5024]ETK34792.1 hypothetical protein MPTA5024_17540 [Microbispora sp. ATCC PTA-5024]